MTSRRVFALLAAAALLGATSCSSGDNPARPDQGSATAAPTGDAALGTETALPRLVVGTDIMPGLNIADDLGTCYYARVAEVDASPEAALGQSNALGAQVFLTVEPTDAAVISVACGEWRTATDADLAPTPDGGIPDDGMWLIPEQITPGTYQTEANDPNADCFYQTVSDLSASLDAVLDTKQGLAGQATMTIDTNVRAVRAYRCGAWTKVSG